LKDVDLLRKYEKDVDRYAKDSRRTEEEIKEDTKKSHESFDKLMAEIEKKKKD